MLLLHAYVGYKGAKRLIQEDQSRGLDGDDRNGGHKTEHSNAQDMLGEGEDVR